MKTTVIKEQYAIEYSSVFPDCDILISWSELKAADVGKRWRTEDGDQYINCNCRADVVIEVIHKNEYGAGVLQHVSWDNGDEDINLVWYEFS